MLLSLPATSQLESEGLSVRKIINLPTLSILSAFILVCCSVSIFGQNREKFVISAKAGGINAVTGQAAMHAKGESDWQQLMITDDLQAGDRVRTALDGRVEILLNPGSYLRLGGNSEVELANNSLANLEVRLLRGTAIVEASGGVEQAQMLINISTPHARLAIDRQGLYRLNVVPTEATEVIVRKGRVILGDSNTKIKSGNKVTFSATAVSVAKLTDEEKRLEKEVAIEQWSKDRAQTLAKANSRINGRLLNSAFARGDDFLFSSWLRSGLWFYNSRTACYTYLPYGYSSSPYGVSYPTTVYGGLTQGGYYPGGGSYGTNGRPLPSTGGGSSYPTASGSSSSSSAAPVRSMPVSAPPRDMDSGSSSPRGFRSERTVEPGRP
jgi:FecR protein